MRHRTYLIYCTIIFFCDFNLIFTKPFSVGVIRTKVIGFQKSLSRNLQLAITLYLSSKDFYNVPSYQVKPILYKSLIMYAFLYVNASLQYILYLLISYFLQLLRALFSSCTAKAITSCLHWQNFIPTFPFWFLPTDLPLQQRWVFESEGKCQHLNGFPLLNINIKAFAIWALIFLTCTLCFNCSVCSSPQISTLTALMCCSLSLYVETALIRTRLSHTPHLQSHCIILIWKVQRLTIWTLAWHTPVILTFGDRGRRIGASSRLLWGT